MTKKTQEKQAFLAFSWHLDVTCSEIPGKVTQKKGKVKVSHFMRYGKWEEKIFLIIFLSLNGN